MSGWELTGVVLLIVFALIVIWAVFTLARAKRAPARTTVDRPSERPGRSDDLTRLEGIGPKSSEALNAAGISTFQQLVDGTEARFSQILEDAGMSFTASTATWSKQAEYLIAGDEAGFATYIEYLDSGVDPAAKR